MELKDLLPGMIVSLAFLLNPYNGIERDWRVYSPEEMKVRIHTMELEVGSPRSPRAPSP